MKTLFCKISCMKYYKGHCASDIPANGGKYVTEHGYGHEEFNFMPFLMEGESESECLGFVEPKSHGGIRNRLHIENIEGCGAFSKEPFVEDVLVIWCATRLQRDITVVGWYRHAAVWRELQKWIWARDGEEEIRSYNVRAKAENCVLLPFGKRNQNIWQIPSARKRGFGFGQSMVWYPTEQNAQPFVLQLEKRIQDYRGENWLLKWPDSI